MRVAARILAGVVALVGLYMAAVLQSGPEAVDSHFCQFISKWFQPVSNDCLPPFVDKWGMPIIVFVVGLCVIFILWDIISWLVDWLFGRQKNKSEDSPPAPAATDASSLAKPPTKAIEINYGEDGPYERLTKADLSRLERQLSIEFKNPHADVTITNCKLELTNIEPFVGYRRPLVVKENFSLAGGDHDYIPFVQYGESRIGDERVADTVVALLAPKGADPWFLAALPHDVENIITLRATAIGAGFCEEKVVIWVGAGTRLRIRKYEGATDQAAYISFEEATKEAYGVARNTDIGRSAETMNTNGVLAWFAWYYHTKEISVYGNVRNSTRTEPVLFRNTDIKRENDKLIAKEIYGDLIWENMKVKRSDHARLLAMLREHARALRDG
jgi:hypothetical protein